MSIATRSVKRKETFAAVTVIRMDDLTSLGTKGRMEATVQAPLISSIRSDTIINQTEGFSLFIS
jgi:hypothetical protein